MEPIAVLDGKTLNSGVRTVIGAISAGALTAQYDIPRRDARNKTGYQREIATTRVNRLVVDLEKKIVDLPTAVLLSLREFDAETDLIERDGAKFLQSTGKLYVVDGQHRIEALQKLVDRDASKWRGYMIPFVCMLGSTERQEMEEFYIVNSTAKSVRTDLAFDLLKQRAESDASIMTALIERQETWKVKAEALVEELERRSQAWKGRVRFSGQDKGITVISNSGLATSLKPILDTPYFGAITQENQIQILSAYWGAIWDLLPEVFKDPTEYALQKSTPGAWVVHSLLISVLEYLRSTGKSVIEQESYGEVLQGIFDQLQGQNGADEPVGGADYWRSGPKGAAGAYSSHAGRRVLLARMRGLLPPLEVE